MLKQEYIYALEICNMFLEKRADTNFIRKIELERKKAATERKRLSFLLSKLILQLLL